MIIIGMCDEEHPYISPYAEALATALLEWKFSYEMRTTFMKKNDNGTTTSISWVKWVHDMAVMLKPHVLNERRAFRTGGKYADKVELLESQTKTAFKVWKIRSTIEDELVSLFVI